MAHNDSPIGSGADDGAARPRKHKRVTTAAVPGSDPRPQREPLRHAENENDARLRADKPPHWG